MGLILQSIIYNLYLEESDLLIDNEDDDGEKPDMKKDIYGESKHGYKVIKDPLLGDQVYHCKVKSKAATN